MIEVDPLATLRRDSPGASLQDLVRRHVLAEIEAGRFAPDVRLPTEKEIAALLGVSLAPVRGAMEQLAQSGYVDRRQGKGTFVRPQRMQHSLEAWGSITDRLREQGVPFRVEVLASDIDVPPHAVAEDLRSAVPLFHLARRFHIDGRPAASLDSWSAGIVADDAPNAEHFTQGASLYAELRRRGIVPRRTTSTVDVAFCEEEDARLMEVPFGTPMLRISSIAHDADGHAIEWSRTLYSPDRFALNMTRDLAPPA